ncbi:hypothetical protein DL770_003269 [Monosporascus sp. CRB-9-2]|nr:hypothetical protein DL770_003269 [Monosporascus sp. CRB-9-2]
MDQNRLPTEINIVTLNCWGLLYLSKHRTERLTAIGRQIATADPVPHIVALQECWSEKDYRSIRRETRFVLPFGKFYYSGPFGGGLAILSRWPIEESSMHRYPLNGRPTAFFRGDWYVGKGVACARIRYGVGQKQVIEVFNTHTHCRYGPSGQHNSYSVHRLSQSWEMAKLIRGAAARGHMVVALGDFNDVPESLPYHIICDLSPVRDAWRVLHPDSSLGAADDGPERARRRPIPTAEFNITENGVTSNSVYNTWRWPKSQQRALGPGRDPVAVPPDSLDKRGQRIDYIFVSCGPLPQLGGSGWVIKDARVGMRETHPELQCSLSDHFSVEATLAFHIPQPESTRSSSPDDQGAETSDRAAGGTYLESPTSSEFRNIRTRASYDGQLRDAGVPSNGLPASTYEEILALIKEYRAREETQKLWRGVHFLFWVLVTVICYVAVWFVPNYGAFVFLLLSTLGLMAGTADGLLALLFFNSELRAVKEFEWEIMNAKASASGAVGITYQDEEKAR